MSDIFAERLDNYGFMTSAEALFFHSAEIKDSKGLRVLLPDKGMEFSDGSYGGTDPAGFFFHRDKDLNEAMGAKRYESDTIINPKNGKLCAWIRFYDSEYSGQGKLVGEFLGYDYFNAVDVAGMKGFGKKGTWRTFPASSFVEANLKKDANNSTLTLDISRLSYKVATMTTEDAELKASSLRDIKGHFYYDSLDKISDGKYVSYSNDRLVFYLDDRAGTTITGSFIPKGRTDNDHLLGITGDRELTLEGTRWIQA